MADPNAGLRASARQGRAQARATRRDLGGRKKTLERAIDFESFFGELSPARRVIYRQGEGASPSVGRRQLSGHGLREPPRAHLPAKPQHCAKRRPQFTALGPCTTAVGHPTLPRNWAVAGILKATPASERNSMSWEACVFIASNLLEQHTQRFASNNRVSLVLRRLLPPFGMPVAHGT